MASSELQALLDAAVDAMIVIDDRGLIVTFNAASERLFRYSAADVVGKPVDVLMPEPYHSQHHTATSSATLQPGSRGSSASGATSSADARTGRRFQSRSR